MSDKTKWNYLGASLKVKTSIWNRKRETPLDSTQSSLDSASNEDLLRQERERMKQADEEMILQALGLRKPKRDTAPKQAQLDTQEISELLKREASNMDAVVDSDMKGERITGLGFLPARAHQQQTAAATASSSSTSASSDSSTMPSTAPTIHPTGGNKGPRRVIGPALPPPPPPPLSDADSLTPTTHALSSSERIDDSNKHQKKRARRSPSNESDDERTSSKHRKHEHKHRHHHSKSSSRDHKHRRSRSP